MHPLTTNKCALADQSNIKGWPGLSSLSTCTKEDP